MTHDESTAELERIWFWQRVVLIVGFTITTIVNVTALAILA